MEIAQEIVLRILLQCKNLKFFHTLELLNEIQAIYKHSIQTEKPSNEEPSDLSKRISKIRINLENICGTLKLEIVYVDHFSKVRAHGISKQSMSPFKIN